MTFAPIEQRDDITDAEMLALGERVHSGEIYDPTNLAMFAYHMWLSHQNRERYEREGCCGGTPRGDGTCLGVGMCPNVSEALRIMKEMEGEL